MPSLIQPTRFHEGERPTWGHRIRSENGVQFFRIDTGRGIDNRRRDLDGLRAIAVLAVFGRHAWPNQFFWGWAGVDLFLVLSGFLITRLLLRAQGDRSAYLKSFYARRSLRIWPLYYLTLALTLAVAYLEGWHVERFDVLRSALFLQFTDLYSEYAGAAALVQDYIPFFSHSWSVAVEEQFYVVWPLTVLLLRRWPRTLPGVAGVLLVAGLGLRTLGVTPLLLLTRVDGLVLGAFLAWTVQRIEERPAAERARHLRTIARVATVTGVPIVAWYVLTGYAARVPATPASTDLHPLVVTGFALAALGVIASLTIDEPTRLKRFLSRGSLVYLGGLSYGIYLLHPLVLHGSRTAFGDAALAGIDLGPVVALPASVAVAHLSMVFVEGPALQLKRRFPLEPPPAAASRVVSN